MTTRIITIEPTRLAAIALFAARKDVRYYLNAVRVEWLSDDRPLLVATDGHRLGAVPGVAELTDERPSYVADLLLDIEKVDAVLRAHGKDPGGIAIEFDDDAAFGALRTAVTLIASNGARFTKAGVDGKFPEWRRIVKLDGPGSDNDRGTLPVSFDPEYMATFAKVARLLAPTKRSVQPMVTLTYWAPDLQLRVTLPKAPEFLGIVMPMRADDCSGQLPSWMSQ